MTANHPDAVRWPALVEHVARLREGEAVPVPVPGTRAAARGDGRAEVGPTRLLIVEGHLVFGEPAHALAAWEAIPAAGLALFVLAAGALLPALASAARPSRRQGT